MSGESFLSRLPRLFRSWQVAAAFPVLLLTLGVLALSAPPGRIARAGQDEQAPVRRPLPADMLESYAEGQVVALQYFQTFYCPTMPSSDLAPPTGGATATLSPKTRRSTRSLLASSAIPALARSCPPI